MTKTIYVLISNGGDGSYHPCYTMDPKLIIKLREAYDKGLMDSEDGIGCDGDGFHFDTIEVPEDCTPRSLGITVLEDDYVDQFFKTEKQ